VNDATGSSPEVDRAYRSVSRRIVPLLFIAYVISYMDAYNMAFAQLQMKEAIGLSDAMYGLGASLLVIGQVLMILPSNLLLHRIGARATILRVMLAWGVGSLLLAFVTDGMQFIVMRFLTGLLTAGMWTGILLYLTYWYPAARRARMISAFLIAPVVAGMIVGPLSGWIIGSMHSFAGLDGWQWMFIIEGLPAFAVAALVYPLLTDRPAEARWLSAGHRAIVEAEIAADVRAMPEGTLNTTRQVLASPRVYAIGLVAALVTFGVFAYTYFMPIMIRDLGVTSVQTIGLLAAIPYVVGGVVMVFYSRHSDRTMERRWHCAGALLASAAGFALLAFANDIVLGMIGITLAGVGLLCTLPTFWPMPQAFLQGSAAASGIAIIVIVGDIGGAIAPPLVGHLRNTMGTLDGALYITSVVIVAAAVLLFVVLPKHLIRERQPAPRS
jgi:MFS family permease